MNLIKSWRVPFVVIIMCVAAGVTARAYRSDRSLESVTDSGAPQDVTNLDRRISLLEQRFYAIETSINRLEQQTALNGRGTAPSANVRDSEITLLRAEWGALQRNLVEIECGLVKLDERTLAAATREARKRAGASSTDPCRLNAEAPLRLSTRP